MAGKDKKRKGAGGAHPASATSARTVGPLVHGWLVLHHPLLLGQLERLTAAAEKEPALTPGPNRKLLGHLRDLMFDTIPQSPDAPAFRHGGALRGGRREWFRAKTGNGRYRLFYRFDSRARIIVYAWVNDDEHLRTVGARSDAYAQFGRMLDAGNPPSSWDERLAVARAEETKAPNRHATFVRLLTPSKSKPR